MYFSRQQKLLRLPQYLTSVKNILMYRKLFAPSSFQAVSSEAASRHDKPSAKELPAPEIPSKATAPVVLPAMPQASTEIQAITEEELVLQCILRKRHSFFQVIDDDKKIFISYGHNLCYSDADSQELSKILLQPVANVKLEEVASADEHIMHSKVVVVDLKPVLWYAIIHCPTEQLFESLRNNTPVKLNKWPDYKLLMNNPSYMKLSAILSKRWSSAQNLAQETNVQMRDINKFINVCYGLKYLSIDESRKIENSDKSIKQKQKNNNKILLSRIRNRLGI